MKDALKINDYCPPHKQAIELVCGELPVAICVISSIKEISAVGHRRSIVGRTLPVQLSLTTMFFRGLRYSDLALGTTSPGELV